MKRVISVLLLAVLLLTACQVPPPKEEVTIIIKVPNLAMTSVTDPSITQASDMLRLAAEAFAAQYEKYDVNFEVVKFAYVDEDKYIIDCLGTDSAPDILFEASFNSADYAYSGHLVPLCDIISEEMLDDIDEEAWANSMINDVTYLLPFNKLQNTLSYNPELFRMAGLDAFISDDPNEIQSWTLEEWDTILAALSTVLPELTYPMMMYAARNHGASHILTLARSQGCDPFGEDRRFNINNPEGIAGLQWIKDCQDKGFFPPNCSNMEMLDCAELFSHDQLAICVMNTTLAIECGNPEIRLVNFPSTDGDGYATETYYGFCVFDNGNEVKIEVAKDFLSFVYSNEDILDLSAGGIPVSRSVTQRYADEIPYYYAYSENSDNIVACKYRGSQWKEARAMLYSYIQAMLLDEMDAEETAAAIDGITLS